MGTTVEMLTKQKEAKMLYMRGDRTNGEISNIVGVSEAALSSWVTKFKWKETRQFRAKRDALVSELEYIDTDFILRGFVEFMAAEQPYLRVQWGMFIDLYKEYLKDDTKY